ncbi:RGR protein, partial [Polypterus senegalus]
MFSLSLFRREAETPQEKAMTHKITGCLKESDMPSKILALRIRRLSNSWLPWFPNGTLQHQHLCCDRLGQIPPLLHKNFVSYVLPMAFFNFVVPVLLILSSYQSVYQKFKKTGQMKFNTGLPLKSLVFCWGPYSIMCLYAVFEDITVFSPKLRMNRGCVQEGTKARWDTGMFSLTLGYTGTRGHYLADNQTNMDIFEIEEYIALP